MRSAEVLERSASSAVSDLLVLWQHPQNRAIIPIGRFLHTGDRYEFAYTQASAEVEDFRPLPGLNDLRRRYTSERIPSVFAQRVMEHDRPDFTHYVRTLGLDPERATPWEQIVHSGGARAGDTLQFMQVPRVERGRARARFLANGVRHIPEVRRHIDGREIYVSVEAHEAALQRLRQGDVLVLQIEDDNAIDQHATLISADGIPVGWVPRTLSASVRDLMATRPTTVKVHRVGAPGTPPHLRLVLDLDAPAPTGFQFDRDGQWEPLVAGYGAESR